MSQKSAAFALGIETAYLQAVTPSDSTFAKVAAKTGFDVVLLKKAFLKKEALNWPAMLAAGAGALTLPSILRYAMSPNAIGQEVTDDPITLQTNRIAARMQNNSHRLQSTAGAFRAAPNPYGDFGTGKQSSLSKESENKIAGFWGGLAGGAAGTVMGGLPGGMGGAALGSWAGDKIHDWWNKKPAPIAGAQTAAPFTADGQINPEADDPVNLQTNRLAARMQLNSHRLQSTMGAFRAAPDPYGAYGASAGR